MRKQLLLALAVTMALVGCGGGGHSFAGPQKTVAPGTVQGHSCAPGNFYMQCALRGQHPPVGLSKNLGSSLARGVDFAWGGPSCSTFHANGWTIAATYYDTFDPSKGWSRGLVDAYSNCGVFHVAVWETSAGRATGGAIAGAQDARNAANYAAAVGEPSNRPIFFAIDCDCSGSQVFSYFDGVKSVLGVSRSGAYGGFYPLRDLFNTGRITYGWQTYAWSGGQWDPRAHLEQWLNDGSVDYDRAIATDYGQWPFVAPPPPGPTPQQVQGWFNARNAAFADFKHRGCSSFVWRHGCLTDSHTVFANEQNLEQQAHVARPACYGAHHRWWSPVCGVTYAYVDRWHGDLADTLKSYYAVDCRSHLHSREARCKRLAASASYYRKQLAVHSKDPWTAI